jgi:hypothetical protein
MRAIRSDIWRRHYAIPAEHGTWVWLIGPLFLGMLAGGSPGRWMALLIIAGLAAFLSRQPASIGVKAISGRRPRADLGPALFWFALYGLIAGSGLIILLLSGYAHLLWLAVPGAVVFGWHLRLVSLRQERGQVGVELFAAGTLSLAAPAAYWVSGGASTLEAAILWLIVWLQAAASIVFVHLRLTQRRLQEAPPAPERWRMGGRALAYHTFNLLAAIGLAAAALVPWLMPAGFGLLFIDAMEGISRPAVGARPTVIGLRQLAASSAFFVLAGLGYLIRL